MNRLLLSSLLLSSIAFVGCGDDGSDGGGTGGTSSTGASSGTGATVGTGGTAGGTGGTGGTIDPTAPDAARAELARQVARRLSAADESACIVTAANGVECRGGGFVRDEAFGGSAELVSYSVLSYCAVLDDGSFQCEWRDNVPDYTLDTPDGVEPIAHLKKNDESVSTVGRNGGFYTWGYDATPHPNVFEAGVPASALAAGPAKSSCATVPGGEPQCFLATMLFPDSLTAVQEGRIPTTGQNYLQFVALSNTYAGIFEDGTFLAADAVEEVTVPGPWTAVDITREAWCLLDNVGGITCGAFVPEQHADLIGNVPTGEFIGLSIGDAFGCGARADGSVECWGTNAPVFTSSIRLD